MRVLDMLDEYLSAGFRIEPGRRDTRFLAILIVGTANERLKLLRKGTPGLQKCHKVAIVRRVSKTLAVGCLDQLSVIASGDVDEAQRVLRPKRVKRRTARLRFPQPDPVFIHPNAETVTVYAEAGQALQIRSELASRAKSVGLPLPQSHVIYFTVESSWIGRSTVRSDSTRPV
ncbi:hypothetical protein STPH1_3409 [Streptomyces sp. OM5714]|nr:hypothetical protein STPH1_3409 [Streptomyces sp. OM5714]